MKPGKELDALIAEKIMGPNAKHYSTDIAAAWDVIEELARRHMIIQLYVSSDVYRASFKMQTQSDFLWHSEGESMPHAICLGALRMMGKHVNLLSPEEMEAIKKQET
jgi:hypothetical protein